MEQSKKEPFLGSKESSDPSVQGEGVSTKGDTSVFAELAKSLKAIEDKYSSPEIKAQFDEFMRKKGYVQAAPGKRKHEGPTEQHMAKMMNHVPRYFVPAEKHLVRYFLMDALRRTKHDIVLHEFPYMNCFCDVLAVVSGRATEFEIKASRADYEADFNKSVFTGVNYTTEGKTKARMTSKHGMLAAGKTMISKFYFVVPENMIDVRELPPHAGMIWYHMIGDVPVFRVVKYPPMLSKEYLSPGSWQTISRRLQVRNWSLEDRYGANKKFAQIKNKTYAQSVSTDHTTDAG